MKKREAEAKCLLAEAGYAKGLEVKQKILQSRVQQTFRGAESRVRCRETSGNYPEDGASPARRPPRRSRPLLEIVHGLLESGAELAPTFGHDSV
jgi:hypothetical protein